MSYINIKKKIKNIPQDVGFITAMFYGKPDTGKTTLLATFPKPLILDIREKGYKSIRKVKGAKMASISSWDELEDMYWYLKKEEHGFETVGWDTTGNAQQLCIEEILGGKKSKGKRAGDWGSMQKKQWGEVSAKMKDLALNFRDLNDQMNVVFLAHQKYFGGNDEDDNAIDPHIGPALAPSVGITINAAVDIIGETFIREKIIITRDKKTGKKEEERDVNYCLRVGPSGSYITKMRNDKETITPDVIKNPTYQKLVELME